MINNAINDLVQKEIEKGIEEFKREYINTQFERNKLYAYLGEDLVNMRGNLINDKEKQKLERWIVQKEGIKVVRVRRKED